MASIICGNEGTQFLRGEEPAFGWVWWPILPLTLLFKKRAYAHPLCGLNPDHGGTHFDSKLQQHW